MPLPSQRDDDLAEILKRLPKLTPEGVAKVASRLPLLKSTISVKDITDKGDDWLYEGIIYELRRRKIMADTQRPPLRQAYAKAPKYEEESAMMRGAFVKCFRKAPDRLECTVLGQLVAKSLARHLKTFSDKEGYLEPTKKGKGFGYQMMLVNVGMALEAFDASFPDYMRNGWMDFLLRAKR